MRWSGRAWGRTRLLAAVFALLGLAAACVPEPPPPPPPPPPTLAFYGDSLAVQSRGVLEQRLHELVPAWDVIIRVYGGTAQCDWHDEMEQDAAAHDVDLVVIAFSGNYQTECIRGVPDGSRDRVTGYREDANWAVDFWRPKGAAMVFVAGPTSVGVHRDPYPVARPDPEQWDAVRDVYRSVGAQRGVEVADEAPLFVGPSTGTYERMLPCLVGESCGSSQLIAARAPDGVHFCVGPEGADGCATYSSGVVRYVNPIIRTVGQVLGVAVPPPLQMVTPTSTTSSTTSTTSSTSSTSTTTTTSAPPP